MLLDERLLEETFAVALPKEPPLLLEELEPKEPPLLLEEPEPKDVEPCEVEGLLLVDGFSVPV